MNKGLPKKNEIIHAIDNLDSQARFMNEYAVKAIRDILVRFRDCPVTVMTVVNEQPANAESPSKGG